MPLFHTNALTAVRGILNCKCWSYQICISVLFVRTVEHLWSKYNGYSSKLVLALPSIRFSWKFHRVISGTKISRILLSEPLTAIFCMEFWPILTFFIGCGHIFIPSGMFWVSTCRPHIGDLVMSLFLLWGPPFITRNDPKMLRPRCLLRPIHRHFVF